VTPAQMPPLPMAARSAEVEHLHLGRKADASLRAKGASTIGDLIDGGYLSRVGWDALGRDGGKVAWGVVQELQSFCHGEEDVDWPGFWASRGVSVVPGFVKGDPDMAALARAVPALLKAALADVAGGGADRDRAWVIIDSRNGLVSQPKTLEELGVGVLGLTRERIRQIEVKAMRQLREAWGFRFRGTSYRVNGALDPALSRLADDCAAVEGLVPEAELLAGLGVPASLRGRDLRPLEFLLELAGLRRFDADGARRQAMWAPESHKSASGRVDLADRLGRLLTEEVTGAVSAADITAALNRRAKGGRVTLRDVEGALPLSPLVELLEDGRWQGRFEYLTRRGDQAFRILDAAGGPVELRDVVREINARSRQKPVNRSNLSNQMAGDDRFVPIGKSGSWGLASRDAAAALSIPDLIHEILRLAGKPMLGRDIDTAVRARRPAGVNSVAIYLATRPEAAAIKGRPRVPSLGERIAEVAIPHLRSAPRQEARLRDLVYFVASKIDVPTPTIYPYFDRHPAFERFERDGQKLVRLSSKDPVARAPVGRKPGLAERMAGVLIPFLESAPGRQRELAEVVRHVTREMDVIPATVYAYVKRIPEVERIDEGDRKLVRLVALVAPVLRPGALDLRVRELITAGETPIVEFKSTLMWSMKGNVKDAKLQKMVTKTIAAFANTRGGTLLIGVEPDGSVCGIELDCAILKGKDDTCVDAFSRSLAAITAEHLGAARAARLSMEFVPVDGKTVCVVDVQRAREPVYLKADGVTEVYVRNGTTSVALPVSEIAGYVQSRWHGSPDRPAALSPLPGATADTEEVVGPLPAQAPIATRAEANKPAAIREAPGTGLVGVALAQQALDVFLPRAGAYPGGIRVDELVRELGLAGHAIGGNDPRRTLRDALNSSQVRGVWQRQDGATWVPGTGVSKMNAGLSGRALAEALHQFVRELYPAREFHYERAREELEATGAEVRGTGDTTRAALVAATDLFESVPDRRAYWRWK
jgi:hypothetical protein